MFLKIFEPVSSHWGRIFEALGEWKNIFICFENFERKPQDISKIKIPNPEDFAKIQRSKIPNSGEPIPIPGDSVNIS